jgi:AAA domain
MQFTKAIRKKAKLRLALTGPSGSGKTYGALMIAKGLGGRIAVIDTEHGSASLYSNLCEFDTLELKAPYSPERYIQAIKAAEAAGYDTLIIDSTTHEWSGSGGCLEINEQTAQAKFRGNTWSAWNETTPRHRKFIDAMLQSSMHIIATGRSKTETSQEEVNGKKKVVKLGMKTEQRDGFEYEFTVVLDLVHDGHHALASKDRTGLFREHFKVSEQTGNELAAWLESGVDPMPEAPWYEELMLTLENCETADELREAWAAAKKAAQDRKDQPAYDAMKTAMESAASAIKEASNAQAAT